MKTTGNKPKEDKTEAVKKTEEAKAPEELKRLMYVGPTLTKYGVIRNVFYNCLPKPAEELMEKSPLFKALFIEMQDYPAAERGIREQTGHYWAAYRAALNIKEDK